MVKCHAEPKSSLRESLWRWERWDTAFPSPRWQELVSLIGPWACGTGDDAMGLEHGNYSWRDLVENSVRTNVGRVHRGFNLCLFTQTCCLASYSEEEPQAGGLMWEPYWVNDVFSVTKSQVQNKCFGEAQTAWFVYSSLTHTWNFTGWRIHPFEEVFAIYPTKFFAAVLVASCNCESDNWAWKTV